MPSFEAKNMLADAASPYLLQHADNPVHWRIWGRHVFEEARETGKPVLISIGYSACHWCHVMAHESFENDETAALMNRLFVNVKIDREERPEIDQIYMAALHAMGQQGGWPLTMFCDGDGNPFYGGTYFPPVSSHGRPAFSDILSHVAEAYKTRRADIDSNVATLRDHLDRTLVPDAAPGAPRLADLDAAADKVFGLIDRANGGIGHAPKFPNFPVMTLLWNSWLRNGKEAHRDAVLALLRSLCAGGIYDHLGGGLARYSVDSRWLAPHFEKMLYDNAQFLRFLCWAHAETGEEVFRVRIEETIGWLAREMITGEGGFAASQDADSEGVEGKFYVWDRKEILDVLGDEAGARFSEIYDITEEGNWEGHNIPNLLARRREAGALLADAELAESRQKLFDHRAARIPPGWDDKCLTDWNGLAIRAVAEAARQFGNPAWLDLATRAYEHIKTIMGGPGGRLAHCYRDGTWVRPGLSSDYGAMILASLALAEAGGGDQPIEDARMWADALIQWHGGENGLRYTASDADDVPFSLSGDNDDAIPSATSLCVEGLARLAIHTGDDDLAKRSRNWAEKAIGRVGDNAFGAASLYAAWEVSHVSYRLELSDRDGPLEALAASIPDPRRVDVHGHGEDAANITGALVCYGNACLAPIDQADALRPVLKQGPSGESA